MRRLNVQRSEMDRRIQKFQFRVQQRLNLADDEIARLQTYRSSLEAEITEITDQLRRFKNQAGWEHNNIQGKRQAIISEHEMVISRMKAQHAAKMSEIEKLHSEEIAHYQEDFQKALDEVEEWGQQCIQRETSAIDSKLQSTTQALQKARQTKDLSQSEQEKYELDTSQKTLKFEAKRIQRLEESLNMKTQNRLDVLTSLKERLAESIATLEDLERDHTNRMGGITSEIETTDRRYNTKVAQLNDKRNRDLGNLQRRLEALTAKTRTLEKAMTATAKRAQDEFESMQVSANELRNEVSIAKEAAKSAASEIPKTDLTGEIDALNKSQAELATKENQLMQFRTENESLKREIARLRHEKMIQMRREFLKQKSEQGSV